METNLRQQIQERASKVILLEKDLLVDISIRVGKTRIALMAVEEYDNVLVCYPNTVIRQSWIDETFSDKYPMKFAHTMTFTTFSSLKKHKDKFYDYIIIDEAQKLSINQINHLKTIKYNKRVGLSGTLSDKTLKKLYYSLGMQVKFKYTIADAIKDKLVKDYRIYIHYCELDNITKNYKYKRFAKEFIGTELDAYNAYTDSMDYFDGQFQATGNQQAKFGFKKYMGLRTNLLYNSENLFNLAKSLVDKYKDDKCLIFTLRQEIADKLSINSYHSKNKDEEVLNNFRASKKGHLSVVNCISSGITIQNLSRVILHTWESNTEKMVQKIGRSMLYQFDGDMSRIHICCIKDSQQQKWLDKAVKLLEQDKIIYIK